MKIGIIEKPGVLKAVEQNRPILLYSNEVLVSVKRVGICGSDIHILHGKNPFATYPRIWGHEFVGEVSETGADVTAVCKGDHVVVEPIISCGTCYACRQGRGNVCESLQVMGVHIDGGCQEYISVPAVNVHRLPPSLPWDEAVLIEPFTIGAQTVLRGAVQPGDVVLVLGAGTIGLAAAEMARLAGATVIVSDLVDAKLEYAKARGAAYTINSSRENLFNSVQKITGRMGANVTIDAVCIKKTFEDAVEVTSAAGRIVELSFSETPSEIAPVNIVKKELTICGSRLQNKRFPVVIDAIEQGELSLSGFATRTFPLDELVEAFDYVQNNKDTVRKVVISIN